MSWMQPSFQCKTKHEETCEKEAQSSWSQCHKKLKWIPARRKFQSRGCWYWKCPIWNLQLGLLVQLTMFIGGPGVPGVRSMGPYVSKRHFWNLTDVTLTDKDINSILTDNANRTLQGNVAMTVTQPGNQLWNQCKRRHPMTAFWI